jgi:hypothetical protein
MRITVWETPSYLKDTAAVFNDSERKAIVDYLSLFPRSGEILVGTGGVRKLRWAIEGKGKSGGARIIYYFHNESLPVYLLAAFGKNEQANISKSERNELAKLTKVLGQTKPKGK